MTRAEKGSQVKNVITEHGYDVIFAKMDQSGNVEILRQSREIAEHTRTIAMISEAVEEIDRQELVTYVTA